VVLWWEKKCYINLSESDEYQTNQTKREKKMKKLYTKSFSNRKITKIYFTD